MTSVSAGERSSLTACRMRVSTTSRTSTVPVSTTTDQAPTTTTLRPSHHFPDLFRERGSGGGSPEGRRRLRTRWIRGGAGRTICPTVPEPGLACGSDAMPSDAPPARAVGPSPWLPYGVTVASLRAARTSFSGREESVMPSRLARWGAVLVLAAATACGVEDAPQAAQTDVIRFASYDFQENQILAELYAE